jgi:hypothetical protein
MSIGRLTCGRQEGEEKDGIQNVAHDYRVVFAQDRIRYVMVGCCMRVDGGPLLYRLFEITTDVCT